MELAISILIICNIVIYIFMLDLKRDLSIAVKVIHDQQHLMHSRYMDISALKNKIRELKAELLLHE